MEAGNLGIQYYLKTYEQFFFFIVYNQLLFIRQCSLSFCMLFGFVSLPQQMPWFSRSDYCGKNCEFQHHNSAVPIMEEEYDYRVWDKCLEKSPSYKDKAEFTMTVVRFCVLMIHHLPSPYWNSF